MCDVATEDLILVATYHAMKYRKDQCGNESLRNANNYLTIKQLLATALRSRHDIF